MQPNGRATPPGLVDARHAARVAVALGVALLPVLMLGPVVPAAAALHDRAAELGWWGAGEVLLLWLAVPAAVFGALALVLAPGLLLALAFDRAPTVEEWLLDGFVLSLLVVCGATALVQVVAGAPVRGFGFIAVALACILLAGAVLVLRLRRGARLRWPFAAPHARSTLAGMMVVPLLLLVGLGPKFYWESFNGDGAHAFETSRLLLHQAVPFWDTAAGEVAGFPGMTSFLFAYPASWFIRLFGELEVSARLPLLLFLPPLAGAIIALTNHARSLALGAAERWLIWLAVAIYTVVVSFSTTYSPYSADVALPATQDTLLVTVFLGFVITFLRRSWTWAALYALLTYVSLPNGLLLLGFWLVAWSVVMKPRPWRDVVIGGAIVASCMAFGAVAPRLLALVDAALPGSEYDVAELLLRFAFLQVTDWQRLLYLIVPCGILPALALLAWKRQDPTARAMTFVTGVYFLFAFVQLRSPLHYYIPAMLLPLVVYWRLSPRQDGQRPVWIAVTAAAGAVALVVSIPGEPGPFTAARTVGESIEDRVGGYDTLEPEQLRASSVLDHLVPNDWDPAVPDATLGGSPLVFNHYAHRAAPNASQNYILQRSRDPAPAGARRIADEGGFAVYVRNEATWRKHLALRPPTPPGARIYHQDRGILFRSEPIEHGPFVIDLPAIAERLGVDVDALARRMGVER